MIFDKCNHHIDIRFNFENSQIIYIKSMLFGYIYDVETITNDFIIFKKCNLFFDYSKKDNLNILVYDKIKQKELEIKLFGISYTNYIYNDRCTFIYDYLEYGYIKHKLEIRYERLEKILKIL